MKVATRVARTRKHAPGEDVSDTLLSDNPIRRFDSHGSAAFVLRDMELHVPVIFGLRGQRALDRLRRLVRNYTNNQPSPYLVVSLSNGVAQHELKDLFSRELGGLTGPLIIAPDAGGRKPLAYRSGEEAAKDQDKLTGAAQKQNSLLLIMYGLDEPSRQMQLDIAKNQLHRINDSLALMLEEDAQLRDARGIMKMDEELKKDLQRMGLNLQQAQQRITGLTNNDFQDNTHGNLLRHLQAIQLMGATTLADTEVQRIASSLGIIPERMAMMGLLPASNTASSRTASPGTARGQTQEAEMTMEQQENAAIHRSRAAFRSREARSDRLLDKYVDEDERLQRLEADALTPEERESYRQQRANLAELQRSRMADESVLESRERRMIHNEEQSRIQIEGTAEGRYVPLATDDHTTTVSQERYRQVAVQRRREGERGEILEDEHDTHYHSAIDQAEHASPQRVRAPGRQRQTAEQQAEARNPVYENRAPADQAVAARRAEQPSREDGERAENKGLDNSQRVQGSSPVTPTPETQTTAAAAPSSLPPQNQGTPVGAPLSQEEQARPQQDVVMASTMGQEDQAVRLNPQNERLPQSEQAERDDQFGRSYMASGTQLPQDRFEMEERLQRDEASFPQTREDRQAMETAGRPTPQGEFDTPERRAEVEQQTAERNAQVQADVDRQRQEAAREEETRAEARRNYDQQQEQQANEAAERERQRQAEQNLVPVTEPTRNLTENEVVDQPLQGVRQAQVSTPSPANTPESEPTPLINDRGPRRG
jgi:hypothetical protein